MDIKKLKKEELLKMREDIDSQLKYIDDSEISHKDIFLNGIHTLSDLKNGDKIFCIVFSGSDIWHSDYVNIHLSNCKELGYEDWVDFTTEHTTIPMGCSSSFRSEKMKSHFFLSIFNCSFRFFTLKPNAWKNDLTIEFNNYIKNEEKSFNDRIGALKINMNDLLKKGDINNSKRT